MGKFVAFDLEITKAIPGGDEWQSLRPLGISCAATLDSDSCLRLWHGAAEIGEPYPLSLTKEQATDLLAYLESFPGDVVTWNGLGFDFQVLADESGEIERCRAIAKRHIDVAFAMFCSKGFMAGLDAVAHGMHVKGKMKEVGGANAPAMWAEGRTSQDVVLRYVVQDVETTMEIYRAIMQYNRLTWITKRGTPAHWLPLPTNMKVEGVLKLPEPDTSWMTTPWPRSKFTGWLEEP